MSELDLRVCRVLDFVPVWGFLGIAACGAALVVWVLFFAKRNGTWL